MLIFDAHLDLGWNALQWNRDLVGSAYTIRTQERHIPGKGRTQGTVALPEMRRGRIAVSFATTLTRSTGRPVLHLDFPSPLQCYGIAHGQLAYYRALEQQGYVRIITELEGLDSHVAEWEAWEASPEAHELNTPPLGFVLSAEGADGILSPDQLEEWWQIGLRVVGITHYGTGRYAGGTGVELGLTDLGVALLAEMERLGVLLDLTHCSDQSFWQALERYSGPVLASHNNCRALVPHQRQFSDEQLKAIIEREGVIGAAFDNWMLDTTWTFEKGGAEKVSLSNVVDHIDYICQVAGDALHVGIGTDLDGGFGREQSPHDLDTIADLQKFNQLLAGRGYSQSDIAAILHGNWLRLLRQSWRA